MITYLIQTIIHMYILGIPKLNNKEDKTMRYMGSKSRLAYDICTKINNIALNENITEYYEPFVGGGFNN